MVGHVRIIAILLIVQGVLELLVSLYYCAFGLFIGPSLTNAMMENSQMQPGGGPPREFMSTVMTATWIVMAACGLVPGVLHCWAGFRNFMFRGRTLGIIALISSVVSMGTVYCCPTSVALLIYGLIVYLNGYVARAFDLANAGRRPEEILAYRYEQPR